MQVSFIASISNILRPWKTTQGAFWKALAPLMTKTEGEGSMGRILMGHPHYVCESLSVSAEVFP